MSELIVDPAIYFGVFSGYDPDDPAEIMTVEPPPVTESSPGLYLPPADYGYPSFDPVWEVGETVVDQLYGYGEGVIDHVNPSYVDRGGVVRKRKCYLVNWKHPRGTASMRFGCDLLPLCEFAKGDRVLDLESSIGTGQIIDVKTIDVIRDDQPRRVPSYIVAWDVGGSSHRFEYRIERETR